MARWVLILLAIAAAPSARAGDDDLPPAATSTQTGPQPPPVKPLNYFALLGREEVWAELEARHQAGGDFPAVIERVTRGLVAAPYLLSPLGEGADLDPDPKFRLDSFDCTTFVETAIAMSVCDELPAVESALDRIRYLAPPEFKTRRHLMTSQWIPGLIAEGYLQDITSKVGGKLTKTVELDLTEARWKKRKVAKALDLGEHVPFGDYHLDYLPTADLGKLVPKIPPGSIINIVRADSPSSPDLITHQALILARTDGTLFVRHASPVSKRVIDETIEKIVKRYQKPRAWPILGINVLRILEPR